MLSVGMAHVRKCLAPKSGEIRSRYCQYNNAMLSVNIYLWVCLYPNSKVYLIYMQGSANKSKDKYTVDDKLSSMFMLLAPPYRAMIPTR